MDDQHERETLAAETAERSRGPTLEEFAQMRGLPSRWLELRRECERIVRDPHFWYSGNPQEAARQLAEEASEILRQQGSGSEHRKAI